MRLQIEKIDSFRFRIEVNATELAELLGCMPASVQPDTGRYEAIAVRTPDAKLEALADEMLARNQRPLIAFRDVSTGDSPSEAGTPKAKRKGNTVTLTDTVEVAKAPKEPKIIGVPGPETTDGKILAFVKKFPGKTSGQLIELLKMTPPTVYSAVSRMKDAGFMETRPVDEGKGWYAL